jgi:hypothetical protein
LIDSPCEYSPILFARPFVFSQYAAFPFVSGVDETLLAPTAPRRVTKLMKARRSRSVQKLRNCERSKKPSSLSAVAKPYQIELPH